MLNNAENDVDEKIYHIIQQRCSKLVLNKLRAGRCRLHLPGFDDIFQDTKKGLQSRWTLET